MRIWKRRLTNDTPVPAGGMRLYFGMSRGRITRGFVTGLGGRPRRARHIVLNGVEFAWSGVTVPPDGVVEAGVCYQGEPPPWGRVVWLAAPGPADGGPAPADEAGIPLAESALIRSPRHFAALRRRELEHREDLLRHQRFFLELDLATSPELFEHEPSLTMEDVQARRGAIEALQGVLRERVLQRGSQVGLASPGAPLRVAGSRDPVHRLSTLMSDVLRRHYPELEEGNVERAERAFELFACGRLRMGEGSRGLPLNGEPNSAFYFLFAEFALLAIAMDVEPAFWSRLLNVLVRTQRLFIAAYGPADRSERRWSIYGERDVQPVSDASVDDARSACEGLDAAALERCAGLHAREAFQL